jgi:hypothetical protein
MNTHPNSGGVQIPEDGLASNGNAAGSNTREPKCLMIGGLVVLMVPIIAWWLIGDLSEPGGSDQFLPIPSIDRRVEQTLGVAASIVTVLACLALWRGCASRIDRRWFRVLYRLIAAGTVLAIEGRATSAKTHGANIGGGMLFFIGTFVVLYLVVGAVDRAELLWREPGSG